MEQRLTRAVPDLAALESGLTSDLPYEERPSVKDHFYDDAQLHEMHEDILADRRSLQLTKTLSFTEFDAPHQLDLAYDVEESLGLCSKFMQQDRNSSDDTITESQQEEQSHFSLSVQNDIDVFLSSSPPEFRMIDPDSAEKMLRKSRHSPISSPESSLVDESAPLGDTTYSYWEQNSSSLYRPGPEETGLLEDTVENEQGSNEAEKLPLISRAGMRKQHTSRRGGYQQNRVRKSSNQVDFLKRVYTETGGKLDRKQRNQVVKATGLSWIQIYKWIFDMQVKDASKSTVLTSNAQPFQIFRVIGRDGLEIGKPLPIFMVEKIGPASM